MQTWRALRCVSALVTASATAPLGADLINETLGQRADVTARDQAVLRVPLDGARQDSIAARHRHARASRCWRSRARA